MFTALNNFDINAIMFIHKYTQNIVFDKIMPYITYMGSKGMVWIIISLLLIVRKKYRHIGIMCLCALFLSGLFGNIILKNIVKRPRPFMTISNVHMLIPEPSGYSFPSGHAASSFAAAGIIYKELKGYGVYALVLAAVIAFSRIYLFAHYPIDVFMGIILGLICSQIVLYIRRKLI